MRVASHVISNTTHPSDHCSQKRPKAAGSQPKTVRSNAYKRDIAEIPSRFFTIEKASNAAELRAIAAQRAQAFWDKDSQQCSEYAARLNLRNKRDSTWSYLEDELSKNTSDLVKFMCLYAWTDQSLAPGLAASMLDGMDLSSMLPSRTGPPRIAIGSLDLNIGQKLAGENLTGKKPPGEAAIRHRAYLSNVSVARLARRQGIATELISSACQTAADLKISHLYVHVALDNPNALQLYRDQCQFQVVQQEDTHVARALNRPGRLLLEKQMV